MSLQEINKRLEELIPLMDTELRKLQQIEYTYNSRYYELFLNSQLGTEGKREAEVMGILEAEGFLRPFKEQKIEFRTLLAEKETLIVIAANIRAERRNDKDM